MNPISFIAIRYTIIAKTPRCVTIEYWIIIAISEHICAEDTLASGGQTIRIDESSQSGIIITALEIIEAGFHVEVVTTIAQGVELGNMSIGDGVALAVGGAQGLAPGIVGILGNRVQGIDPTIADMLHELDHIALQI